MKRRIVTAADSGAASEAFEQATENLKDNFDYVMEGFDKLSREGKENENAAMQLVLELTASVEDITKKIASHITE